MTLTGRPELPATSADVARLAGVSRSTVSRILSGNHGRFPEHTRQKVHDAARELDYQPSVAGRSLVSGRSDTIVVLVVNATFATRFQDAVDRVMTTTSEIGGNVVIRLAAETPRATAESLAMLRPLAVVDFGVLGLPEREWLESRGVIIVPPGPETDGGDSDGGIIDLQVSALLERDREALWFAGNENSERDQNSARRRARLVGLSESSGLPAPGRLTVDLTLASGTDALRTVLAGPLPAGIACYNDDVAMTLLAAARELAIRIPEDVAVVGVDNSPLGQMWSPRLTTVDTNLRRIVDSMAHQLRRRLGRPGGEPELGDRRFTLVRGETT